MRLLRVAWARLTGVFRRSRPDTELDEELRAHLEMATADYIHRGLDPVAARRQARLESGGLTQAAEAVRDQRTLPWVESLVADFRYALRSLRHSPAFVVVVVLTLSLGIGANTAIFSVVRGVLLKPLPHRDGDRLVYLRHSMDGPGGANLAFSVPEVRDFRQGAPSLGGIAEFSPWTVTLQGSEGASRVDVALVTGNYFEVMGLDPLLGRLTNPSDDGAGAPPVAVLTHQYWVRRFGADSGVVGTKLTLDGGPVTVIGVLEAAPFFPNRAEMILNMSNSQHHVSAFMVEGRTHRMTEVVARMVPGAALGRVQSEIGAVITRAHRDHPSAYDPNAHHSVSVIPFKEALGERARLTLWLLMAAAAFVMVISAANVANLTLMRGVRRSQELVVRAALGAGVLRLRRLLLAENLVLTAVGAAIGVSLAIGGIRLLTNLAARYSPRADEIRLDSAVLGFTVALAVSVAFLLAFVATIPKEGHLAGWILAGTQRIAGGLGRHRVQRALVVLQVAVSVILLAGAGLLTRTMLRLADVHTGLKTEEILTIEVPLLTPVEILSNPAADAGAKAKYEQMRSEIAALPGAVDVGVGSVMPLRSSSVRFEMKVEGRTLEPGETMPRAEFRTADPSFFRAAGIPLLAGRGFSITDQRGAERVVILNQTLATKLFGAENPIGRRVAWTGDVLRFTPISPEWRTVVGVVATTQDGGLDAEPRPAAFLPFAQEFAMGGGLVIRADSNVASLIRGATQIVRRIAPTAPIEQVLTVAQYKSRSVAPRKLNAVLVSSFGLLAILIAAVGIAGVLAFSVSARTAEIGIRMSLGAERARVQRMILGEGGRLLGMGLVLGVVGAYFTTRIIRGLLFGVAPNDPLTLVMVAGLMVVVGVVACWVPARRAARIDPAIALRA